MSRRFSNPIFSLVFASALVATFPALLHAADMPMTPGMAMPMTAPAATTTAIAVLVPTQGNEAVHGTVRFTKVAGGVHVVADVTGLKPGEHGFHIHEFGDASSADGTAAGGHFNPGKESHGAATAEHRHEGDLGNITADATGHAVLDTVDTKLSFEGAASILGHGVVVHADADDLKTQPTGNAGKRVAVGVIGLAKGA
jgi:Cu-Zn family superoxide dismutase